MVGLIGLSAYSHGRRLVVQRPILTLFPFIPFFNAATETFRKRQSTSKIPGRFIALAACCKHSHLNLGNYVVVILRYPERNYTTPPVHSLPEQFEFVSEGPTMHFLGNTVPFYTGQISPLLEHFEKMSYQCASYNASTRISALPVPCSSRILYHLFLASRKDVHWGF